MRIGVATSVMLTFISYWPAAAIILNDLGSSAFYGGGIAEEAVGKSAPWLIIGVMFFSFTILIASGDLRRSANQVGGPTQKQVEEAMIVAISGLGRSVSPGHPFDPVKEQPSLAQPGTGTGNQAS